MENMMENALISKEIISHLITVMGTAVNLSAHPESELNEVNGSLLYCSGCDFPFFNGIFNNYKNQGSLIKDDLPELINFFL